MAPWQSQPLGQAGRHWLYHWLCRWQPLGLQHWLPLAVQLPYVAMHPGAECGDGGVVAGGGENKSEGGGEEFGAGVDAGGGGGGEEAVGGAAPP